MKKKTWPKIGRVWNADNRKVLARLRDNSIDSIVTDPPYHLTTIVKRFSNISSNDSNKKRADNPSKNDAYARSAKGFMGHSWDGGDIAFDPTFWAECFRVLKPGGYLLSFAATRNYHRMAVSIEDSGFVIRDMISWVYGSGFPKSQDVATFIDKELGVKRKKVKVVANFRNPKSIKGGHGVQGGDRPWMKKAIENGFHEMDSPEPVSELAREYSGFKTGLKPAVEPICMAFKPLSEPNYAKNIIKHRTGALNIDTCRVEVPNIDKYMQSIEVKPRPKKNGVFVGYKTCAPPNATRISTKGRYPSNLVHDGSNQVCEIFSRFVGPNKPNPSRFFYVAKPSKVERNRSNNTDISNDHPTVKPVDLMRYLVKMVTPPKGLVFDPFLGSGTTAVACMREGFRFLGVEREKGYYHIVKRRVNAERKK